MGSSDPQPKLSWLWGTRFPSGPASREQPREPQAWAVFVWDLQKDRGSWGGGESAATPSHGLGGASLLRHQDKPGCPKLCCPALPSLTESR